MNKYVAFEDFTKSVAAAANNRNLSMILGEMTREMGFSWFAVTHHLPAPELRISNYPGEWIDYFDRNGLGFSDPVHRTSHRSGLGFRWTRVGDIIDPTGRDRRIFELAKLHGIVDGFTVPFNLANEPHGSCSFAVRAGDMLNGAVLPLAQLVGLTAFEGARQIWRKRKPAPADHPKLTDRQRDCMIHAGRGMSDHEIAKTLGISKETVVRHLKQARDRYNVKKLTSLLIRAMFDGTISYTDIFVG